MDYICDFKEDVLWNEIKSIKINLSQQLLPKEENAYKTTHMQ